VADDSPAFDRTIAHLKQHGGATIRVPDGTYGLSKTLLLIGRLGVQMSHGATLLALPGFGGDEVVQGEVSSAEATERGFTNQPRTPASCG
jgi:polygalacturonase